MNELLPVLILTAFVFLFGGGLLLLASVLGPKKKPSEMQSAPYECGVEGEYHEKGKVSVSFYLTAILFVLFDIEIIFMYPWAVSFSSAIEQGYGLQMLAAMGFFIFIFIFGLFWEIKSKALEWD